MAGNGSQLVVDGRSIKITNPDKVMYPATGTTKGEVIDYYLKIASVLVPQAVTSGKFKTLRAASAGVVWRA